MAFCVHCGVEGAVAFCGSCARPKADTEDWQQIISFYTIAHRPEVRELLRPSWSMQSLRRLRPPAVLRSMSI